MGEQACVQCLHGRGVATGLDEPGAEFEFVGAHPQNGVVEFTRHGERVYAPRDAFDSLDARPWATGLIYPVISLRDPLTHALSRQLLLGDSPTTAQIDRRSAELHVDASTTPAFLCHALDDTAVPVENSLRMLASMREAQRPVEAHLLQEGGHAFGVGRPGTPSAQWIDLYCAWLDRTS